MRAGVYTGVALALAAILSTPAMALECPGSSSGLFKAKTDGDVKFALASVTCGENKWASASTAPAPTEPTPATGGAAAQELSEQLRLYDDEVAFASIEDTRPLYVAAFKAVTEAPAANKPRGPVSRSYAEAVAAVARKHDIDPDFLHAIMHVESRSNPRAVSHAGARGLMQVMPATAKRFGVRDPMTELYDPYTNLNVSAVYLKKLQQMFGNDLRLVLAGYNAGEGAVMKYGRKVPPYRETQGYVKNVLARYEALRGAATVGQ